MDKYLTLSVDDGHPLDLKVADLLEKYGLKATFYIPARNPERPVIAVSDIQSLAKRFEIGAHTFNHKPLKGLSYSEIKKEVVDGKTWLEDQIGNSIVSFCYPRGKFCSKSVHAVKEAGFTGARTCLYNLQTFSQNPFLWGVSTHAYTHSTMVQIRHALVEQNWKGLWNFFTTFQSKRDWDEHFLMAVNHVEKNGGVAHLYLHGWEIEEQKQWERLEKLFVVLSKRQNLFRVTNGELFCLNKHG